MIFINPWASYKSEDIPDLTPHTDEEAVGCLAGGCGFVVSSIIYVLLFYLCFDVTKDLLMPTLIMIVIYPILTICLIKLSLKIGDKIYKRKRK